MPPDRNTPNIIVINNIISRSDSLKIPTFRQRIIQFKFLIHIENGRGLDKNRFLKEIKKNKDDLITHNRL